MLRKTGFWMFILVAIIIAASLPREKNPRPKLVEFPRFWPDWSEKAKNGGTGFTRQNPFRAEYGAKVVGIKGYDICLWRQEPFSIETWWVRLDPRQPYTVVWGEKVDALPTGGNRFVLLPASGLPFTPVRQPNSR